MKSEAWDEGDLATAELWDLVARRAQQSKCRNVQMTKCPNDEISITSATHPNSGKHRKYKKCKNIKNIKNENHQKLIILEGFSQNG